MADNPIHPEGTYECNGCGRTYPEYVNGCLDDHAPPRKVVLVVPESGGFMADQTPDPRLDVRWIVRQDDPIALLTYDDGTVRVEHTCNGGGRWGGGVTHVVAPALQTESGGHVVTQDTLGPTVTPSILCPDCGLHGFVTNGEWRSC